MSTENLSKELYDLYEGPQMPTEVGEYIAARTDSIKSVEYCETSGAFSGVWEIEETGEACTRVALVLTIRGKSYAVWGWMAQKEGPVYAYLDDCEPITHQELDGCGALSNLREERIVTEGYNPEPGWFNCDPKVAEDKEALFKALREVSDALTTVRRKYWAMKLGIDL